MRGYHSPVAGTTGYDDPGRQGQYQPAEHGEKICFSDRHEGNYHTAGFSVKGAGTSWNEQGKVYAENGNWVFENTVNGQNDGKAVRFTSTILNGYTVQFSNPAHDFPTDINYTIADPSTLNAFIVGPNNKGGKDTIPFHFSRVK